jgi:hypothetical protein
MDSRERTRRAILFERPDRVPFFHRFLKATQLQRPELVADLQARYGGDMAEVCWTMPPGLVAAKETSTALETTDVWGCTITTGVQGLQGIATRFPLADWRALDGYPWPDFRSLGQWELVPDMLRREPHKYHAAQYPLINPFERMQDLRGMETLFMDLAEGDSRAYELRDRVVDAMLVAVALWCQTDVDTINFQDDWGSQRSLLIKPALWRSFFRPAYERLFAPARQAGKLIFFHSCGMNLAIIPDLIELGVNIINVQHSMMGLDQMAPFRGRVCFLTQMDGQHVLPYGTPAEVRQHVREVFAALGTADGGIIGYAPIMPDYPPENVEALYAAYVEFGSR